MSEWQRLALDFRSVQTLTLTVDGQRFVLTVNGVVHYDGTRAGEALSLLDSYRNKLSQMMARRGAAGLPFEY